MAGPLVGTEATRRKSSLRRAAFIAAAVALGAIAVMWCVRSASPSVETPTVTARSERDRPAGQGDEPYREFTADGELKRVQHKDGKGLSPLETVQTRDGLVTIQRTFRADGTLLEEKALLDGQAVAVPRE